MRGFFFFRTRLSENETRRYFLQMTSAINYMHAQNILHRDIKLDNMVLQGGVKVVIVGKPCNYCTINCYCSSI